MADGTIYNNGTRGLDFWSDEQIEGEVRKLHQDLELLEETKMSLERRIKMIENSVRVYGEELQERRDKEAQQ